MKKITSVFNFILNWVTPIFVSLLVAFMLVCFLLSCSKEASEPDPSSKIEFTAYGNTRTYLETSAGVVRQTPNIYSFTGTRHPSGVNHFTLSVMTDSLRPGSYPASVISVRDGNTIFTNVSSTVTVVVSSNVNGLVNATFTGSMTDHSTGSTCTVNGLIQNIQTF